MLERPQHAEQEDVDEVDWEPPEFYPFDPAPLLPQAIERGIIPPSGIEQIERMDRHELAELCEEWDQTHFLRWVPNSFQSRILAALRNARVVLARSGNRAGKSQAGCLVALYHLLNRYPKWWEEFGIKTWDPPVTIRCGINEFGEHGKVIEKKMRVLMPRWGDSQIWKVSRNQDGLVDHYVHKPTGSELTISTYKQDPMVWESSDQHFVWLDEPPPRHVFVGAWRGLAERGGQMLITCTPLREPWMFDEFDEGQLEARIRKQGLWEEEDPAVCVVIGSSAENTAIDQKELKTWLSTLTDAERKAREHGEYLFLDGTIFAQYFSKDRHVVPAYDIPTDWPIWCAIDPHQGKPTAVLYVTVSPIGQHIYFLELLISDSSPDDVAMACWEVEKNFAHPVQERLIDATADKRVPVKVGRSSKVELKNWLQAYTEAFEERFGGYEGFVKVTNAHATIPTVQRRLTDTVLTENGRRLPRIVTFDSCEHLIRQFRKYQLDVYRSGRLKDEFKEVPLKKDDDLLDCLLYLEARDLSYIHPDADPAPRSRRPWMAQ